MTKMRTTDGHRWTLMFLIGVLALSPSAMAEETAITILQSPKAPDLEKYAGEELARILETLFDAKVSVKAEPGGDEQNVILLGSKETHPAIGEELACGPADRSFPVHAQNTVRGM